MDPRGIPALRTEYDDSGRMIRQIDAQGAVFEFQRDLAQHYEIIRDRTGSATIYEYDDRGNVIRLTDPLDAITTFTYDDLDNLIRRVDPLGQSTSFTYDNQSNLRSKTNPLGHTTYYTYDGSRRLTSVTDPRGSTIAYLYNPELECVADPAGIITTFGLTPGGLITAITNALGHVITFDYDHQGRVIRETRPNGRTTDFQHDDLGRPVQFQTSTAPGDEPLLVQFEYDPGDRITLAIGPDGSRVRLSYDSLGNLEETEDALGRQSSFRYDNAGRRVETSFADLARAQFEYDAEGRLVTITNALGQVTRITRDPLGRPTTLIHPDGARASARYDLAGRPVVLTDARGSTTLLEYDAAGQIVAITNALGEITRYEYDPNGNRTMVRNAAGRQTDFEYDALNRLVAIHHPDGTSQHYTYDALGRLISTTDPAGVITRFDYDPEGLLIEVTDASGNVTRFEYDAFGRCTSQIDAVGNVTRYQHNASGRLIQRALPNGQSEYFTYDLAGNLTAHTDFNGHTTAYLYDERDRLLEKIPDPAFGAPSVAYTYNAAGLRASMADVTGITRYEYDACNRRASKSWYLPGLEQPLTLAYDYDPVGNLTRLHSTHFNGVDVQYNYDALNRLSDVTDGSTGAGPTTTYQYDPAGDLIGVALPNGLVTSYQHDARHRLVHIATEHPSDGLVAEFGYVLAPAGHRVAALSSISDGLPASVRQHQYTYDSLYQLTGETLDADAGRAQLSYAYDPIGNRLSRSVSGPGFGILNSSTDLFDPNQQLVTDLYDANGNTRQSILPSPFNLPVTDVYDFENHLAQRNAWISGESWSIAQLHDGDGRLVAQTVNGSTTYFLVDALNPTGRSQILEELVRTGEALNPIRVLTFGHDLLQQEELTLNPDNTLQWQLRFQGADGQGSVRYLTDPAGAVTDVWDYDAFGNVIAHTGESANNYLFAGLRWDPNLQLYDCRARYYQPDTGRFWSRDPFPGFGVEPRSLHPYLFAANDPVNRLDPDGHFSTLSMSLGVTYGLSLRTMYNGVLLQVGYGLMQTLESLQAGRSDEQVVLDYFLASARDITLGFGTAYAAKALWPALVRVASQPLASVAQTYSKSSPALNAWRNGTILSARELVHQTRAAHLGGTSLGASSPQHVFWSGGNRAESAAREFAGRSQGIVIGDTAAGRELDRATDHLAWPEARPQWLQLSEDFARTAAGEVNVFHNSEGLFLDSIWRNEYRILTQNPEVTRINFYVVLPNGSVILAP